MKGGDKRRMMYAFDGVGGVGGVEQMSAWAPEVAVVMNKMEVDTEEYRGTPRPCVS